MLCAHRLSHFALLTTLGGEWYNPLFTEEETAAPGGGAQATKQMRTLCRGVCVCGHKAPGCLQNWGRGPQEAKEPGDPASRPPRSQSEVCIPLPPLPASSRTVGGFQEKQLEEMGLG